MMAKPQIFNRDMKRLAYLDNALAVGYGLETNSLWTATFTLPADDPKNAYCTPLNFVEIFDGDERIDLFRIIGEDMERSNGATRYYDCEHVLATLLSDVLFQYHQCGGSGVKTADVLNYILARQTKTGNSGLAISNAILNIIGKTRRSSRRSLPCRSASIVNTFGRGIRPSIRGRSRSPCRRRRSKAKSDTQRI